MPGRGPTRADRGVWGAQLRVAPSQSKHKLYVGNIPKELTRDTLKEQISAVAKGQAPFLHDTQLSSPSHDTAMLGTWTLPRWWREVAT